jgi:hypothetical protein
VRVELGPASFDAAAPQQEDLRVVDPAGNETALLVDRPPVPAARLIRPSGFEVKVAPGRTEIIITTGTADKLSSLSLETPSPFFLRAARLEVSDNASDWAALDEGAPIFREWGAERLELPIGGRAAAFVRVTISDNLDAPLPFTGATLLQEAAAPPAPVPIGARISARDEFAGETVLTLALDGRNVPLAAIEFETAEPLFMRRVAVTFREVRNAIPAERTMASGTIFRVALNGAPSHERMELAVHWA